LAVALLLGQAAYAIHRGPNDLPYGQALSHPLDKPVNDAYAGKAFFMNLGPTGIRARIDPEAPKAFEVMFVFQDDKSPARGKISKGDMIVGANGKRFEKPHGFHRKQGGRGWPGPPYELAGAIEESQGTDGKLDLLVIPAGSENEASVTLQLKPVGRFSETYPWKCKRSDKLRADLCDFLFAQGIKGRQHHQIQKLLALWAAGDERVESLVKAKAKELMGGTYSPTDTAMITWNWGYIGIFLGEYYNAYKDENVRKTAEALAECYELGQDWISGGYSHRPYPAIQLRIAGGGGKGYGSMAGTGGLAMLAQSIFKEVGLPYSQRAHERQHLAFLQTAGSRENADIAYSLLTWPEALIRLRDPDSPCKSPRGIGYRCPTGMENVGKFEAEKWTQKDGKWCMELVPPTGEFSWLLDKAEDVDVFESGYYVTDGSQQRKIIRRLKLEEPTKPYETTPGGGGHVAPMGMAATAHFIGNEDKASWEYLGKHLAAGCALNPGKMFDGHADARMYGFFSVLGAGWADEEPLRHYLDYTKTLIILSESHDGQGLIDQPFGCQRNATCSLRGHDRTAYTHAMILLLSLPKNNLLITGAEGRD
jgi:hypothetical protein